MYTTPLGRREISFSFFFYLLPLLLLLFLMEESTGERGLSESVRMLQSSPTSDDEHGVLSRSVTGHICDACVRDNRHEAVGSPQSTDSTPVRTHKFNITLFIITLFLLARFLCSCFYVQLKCSFVLRRLLSRERWGRSAYREA